MSKECKQSTEAAAREIRRKTRERKEVVAEVNFANAFLKSLTGHGEEDDT